MSLEGLLGQEYLTDLRKNLTDATGISFVIIDYRGNPVIDYDYDTMFCSSFESQDLFYKEVQVAYAMAAAKSAIQSIPYVFHCPSGFINMAIPFIVKNHYLGAFIGGPIICTDNSRDFESIPATITAQEYNMNAMPAFEADRIRAIAGLVYRISTEIGEKYAGLIDHARFRHNVVHYDAVRKRNAELEERVADLEFANLRIKFPPQLFLNLMTSLSNLAIIENAEKTETLVSEFSSILRFYLQESSDWITVERELSLTERYLDVLRLQFENIFEYRINCQEILKLQQIPSYTLIPFIVLMVDHFLSARTDGGRLYVDVEQEGQMCRISMQMDGNEPESGSKFGIIADLPSIKEQIENNRRRLRYIYGSDFSIQADHQRTIIEIPMIQSGH